MDFRVARRSAWRGVGRRAMHTNMVRRAGRLVAVVLLASGLVTTATVATASAGSKQPTPKQWAKGVCSSISTWINDVESTLSSLRDESSIEDAINTAADGIKQSTDELVTSLGDLGLPQTKNSKQAKEALDTLGTQLEKDAQQIQQSLESLGDDPVDIASTFADVGTVVQRAVDQLQAAGDTLLGLSRNGELQKALKSSPACKELKQAL